MSEVKFDIVGSIYGREYSEFGQFVGVEHYDAAQSELAALREELARVQKISDNYYSLTVEANQRLADAERRNAVMADLLRLIQVSHGTMLLSDPPQDPWKYHQIDAKISAALTKPEEAKS